MKIRSDRCTPWARPMRRMALLVAALAVGLLASAALLAAGGAWAAPMAPDTYNWPGGAAPCDGTLQACIDDADAGSTIIIQAGTHTVSVSLSKAISLTGVASNTVILQPLAGQRVLSITEVAVTRSVVISGLTLIGGDLTGGSSCPANCGGAIRLQFGPQPLLANLIITGGRAYHGGGVYVAAGFDTELRLTNSQVLSNTATGNSGGGVYAEGAAVVNGGLFQGNLCSDTDFCFGGGMNSGTPLAMTGTRFISNTAGTRGGGLYTSGPAMLNGVLFQGNTCPTAGNCYGGGMLNAAALTLTNVSFISNTAQDLGGGMLGAGPIFMTGGLFQGNTCTGNNCQGGGLFAFGAIPMTVSGTRFISNSAIGDGGGAFAGGPLTLTLAVFERNTCTLASCAGGGLVAAGQTIISNTQFLTNTAGRRGGGLATHGPTALLGGLVRNNQCTESDCEGGGLRANNPIAITGTQFISNSARTNGGGVQATDVISVANALFERNFCALAGCLGGALHTAATAWVSGTQVLSNTAVHNGGGLYAAGGVTMTGSLLRHNRCTGSTCTGGGLHSNAGLALTSTQIISNSAGSHGAGAYAGTSARLSGGLFERNTCAQPNCSGGGLYAGAALTASQPQFISNTTDHDGAGAWVGGAAVFTGGLFQGNTCTANDCFGGGLYMVGALTMTDVSFIANNSRNSGGGAYASSPTALNGGLFQANACGQDNCQGGGLHTVNGLSLTGTQFISNTARFSGGGAYANAGAVAVLTGGLFQGNRCTQTVAGCRGGGLLTNGDLVMSGTRFINNVSLFDGGGLRSAGKLSINNGWFEGNTAVVGGGLYHGGNSITATGYITNTLFGNNYAANSGMGVYVFGGTLTLVHNTIANSSHVPVTTAVQLQDGGLAITNTLFYNFLAPIHRAAGSATQDYNLFSQTAISTTGGVGGGANSLLGNAGLLNPNSGNFRIYGVSDAIDRGANLGVAADYYGTPRPLGAGPDIGFHELILANVSVSKAVNKTTAEPGDALSYTIVISNTGPYPAPGVLVEDYMALGLDNVTWTCAASGGAACPASGVGIINHIITLTVGGRVTFTVQALVAEDASGLITNIVGVFLPSTVHEVNYADNFASVDTAVGSYRLYLPMVKRE